MGKSNIQPMMNPGHATYGNICGKWGRNRIIGHVSAALCYQPRRPIGRWNIPLEEQRDRHAENAHKRHTQLMIWGKAGQICPHSALHIENIRNANGETKKWKCPERNYTTRAENADKAILPHIDSKHQDENRTSKIPHTSLLQFLISATWGDISEGAHVQIYHTTPPMNNNGWT